MRIDPGNNRIAYGDEEDSHGVINIANGTLKSVAGIQAEGGVDRTGATTLGLGTANASAVAIGKAGTAAGNGVRNGASRYIVGNKPTAPVDIAGGITATVTQLLEAGVFLCSASATLTLPTAQGATGIVQALPGAQVGDIIEFQIAPSAAQTATLAAGTGSTISGIATAAASRIWRGRVTAITANSETITWY